MTVSFTPTTWNAGVAPGISATELNRIEQGIVDTAAAANTNTGDITTLTGVVAGKADASALSSHTSDTSNPHSVTAAQAAAVPLAGGTMTGRLILASGLAVPQKIIRGAGIDVQLAFRDPTDASTESGVTAEADGDLLINVVTAGADLLLTPGAGGEVRAAGARVLTTADEGTGNGLDADTVDALQGTQFLRADTSDEMVGVLDVTRPDDASTSNHLRLYRGATARWLLRTLATTYDLSFHNSPEGMVQLLLALDGESVQMATPDTGLLEVFPYGTLLAGDNVIVSAPTLDATWRDMVSDTITLDYSGQPVMAWWWGFLRLISLDTKTYTLRAQADGTSISPQPQYTEPTFGLTAQPTFYDAAHDISGFTGVTSSHSHLLSGTVGGVVSGTTSGGTIGSNGDGDVLIPFMAYRAWTPAGSTISLGFQAKTDSGASGATPYGSLTYLVMRG